MIYSGCSGIVLPVKNKLFYPSEYQDKPRLSYYSSLFNSIEINSSFYKLPQGKTIKKWTECVSDNFKFTFKLWKEITHNKGIAFDPEKVEPFFKAISEAGNKKGCLLVQLPPSVTIASIKQFDALLNELSVVNLTYNWRIAIEFRSATWHTDEVYELLNSYGFSMVIHDKAASTNLVTETDADFVYLRFHGPDGNYRGSYEDEYLYEFAQYVKEWQQEGKDVYIYFNNTMGNAVHNLITLNDYIKAED